MTQKNKKYIVFVSRVIYITTSGSRYIILQLADTGFEPMTFGLWARQADLLL